MLVNQIIRDTSIIEEEKIQKLLDKLIVEGHIKKSTLTESQLFETADYIEVDGKFWVDYGSAEGGRDMHQFNSERQARRAVNDYNRTGRLTAGTNTRPIDAAAFQNRNTQVTDAERQLAATKRARYIKYLTGATKGFKIIITAIGLVYQYQEHVRVQGDLYNNYLLGAYGEPGSSEAIREFQELSKAVYGIWLSQIIAAIINAVAGAAIFRKLILAIRSAVTLGLIGTTGPLGALIAFIGGEAISYGVLWLLTKPSTIEFLVKEMFDVPWYQAAFMRVPDIGDAVSDGAVTSDLQQAMNMQPQADLIDRGVAQQQQRANTTGNAQPAAGNRLLDLPAFD